ncbi:MAG TPA: hypothetical protein VFW23_00715 [Tepidisphaeraceae bacterium]|nr:hypothetical protein [Tepidisphaeraceae bacterium]
MFDALADNQSTRIGVSCKPALEFLAFVGLQRFRPREFRGDGRFVYCAWDQPLPSSIAAAIACQAVYLPEAPCYCFRFLYRTKYLKSFLPAQSFQGDLDE